LQGAAQTDLAGQGNHKDNGKQRTAGQDNSGHATSFKVRGVKIKKPSPGKLGGKEAARAGPWGVA
jgi:hypothetical protein